MSKSPLISGGFQDEAVKQVVGSMIRGMTEHAPDFYAEITAQWLAVHLLSRTAPWRGLVRTTRKAETLNERRLANVIEFMEANKGSALSHQLLVTTDMPLKNIAAACGYTQPSHFVAAFRRFSGHAPSSIRANK